MVTMTNQASTFSNDILWFSILVECMVDSGKLEPIAQQQLFHFWCRGYTVYFLSEIKPESAVSLSITLLIFKMENGFILSSLVIRITYLFFFLIDLEFHSLQASRAWMEWLMKKRKAFNQRGDMAIAAWAEQQQRELNIRVRSLSRSKVWGTWICWLLTTSLIDCVKKFVIEFSQFFFFWKIAIFRFRLSSCQWGLSKLVIHWHFQVWWISIYMILASCMTSQMGCFCPIMGAGKMLLIGESWSYGKLKC